MRTSVTLLAVGIAAVLVMMGTIGSLAAGQTVGTPPTTLTAATAAWTGDGGHQVLLVKKGHQGSHRGSGHHGRHFRSGLFFSTPLYGYPYYGGYYDNDTPIDQPACIWNGYKYRCFDPDGNPL
ncbi:MAG: hypothetical protein HY914_12275 [Desulfomonile tiedjei]|nr:hypothetical protein [Desulfomonile tiedjei]